MDFLMAFVAVLAVSWVGGRIGRLFRPSTVATGVGGGLVAAGFWQVYRAINLWIADGARWTNWNTSTLVSALLLLLASGALLTSGHQQRASEGATRPNT